MIISIPQYEKIPGHVATLNCCQHYQLTHVMLSFSKRCSATMHPKSWVIIPRLSRNTANEPMRGKGQSVCVGYAKCGLYSTDYLITGLFCTAKSMHFIAKCEVRQAGWSRSRFMLHVFSCEKYSKAEELFPPIVNLTSSMVQDC